MRCTHKGQCLGAKEKSFDAQLHSVPIIAHCLDNLRDSTPYGSPTGQPRNIGLAESMHQDAVFMPKKLIRWLLTNSHAEAPSQNVESSWMRPNVERGTVKPNTAKKWTVLNYLCE